MSLRRLFCFLSLLISFSALAQNDSIENELKRIKQNNEILRIKDSIRTSLLKDELTKIISPKGEDLDKYKEELLKIKEQDSLRRASQKQAIDALRAKTQPHPVTLFNHTLFNIYWGLGPFSSQDRATTAENQIQALYKKKMYFSDSLTIQTNQEYINIMYEGNVITSISIEDAIWENTTQDSLAIKYHAIIDKQILNSRAAHTFENNLQRWLMAIAIFILFVITILALRRVFAVLIQKILSNQKYENKNIHIKNYRFLNTIKVKMVAIRTLRGLHFCLTILALWIAISMIFGMFPTTETWAYRLLHWILDPLKELGHSFYLYMPRLVRLIVILVLGYYVNKILKYLSLEIERGTLKFNGFHTDWAQPTYQLLRICLIAFVMIMGFPYLPGSNTSAFRGVSIFFGVLLSLGSTSAISNTIAGFIITYMRPFQIGDWIKINDVTGEVIEKTALVTRLRTINNEDITLPNSMILSNKTINYSSSSPEKNLIISIEVNIHHEVSFEKVNEMMLEAAKRTNDIVSTPAPFVFKNKIDDTTVNYRLNAFTQKPERMYFITSDLNDNLLHLFKEANISPLSPKYYPMPHPPK